MNMKSNISVVFAGVIAIKTIFLTCCTERALNSFEAFSGFWVTESKSNSIFITNNYALDDATLGCIFPIIKKNGDFYLVDSCVNVINYFPNSVERYRIELNEKNQLLIYYDNDNPEIPWVFERLEVKVCEPQISEIRLDFVGFLGPYAYYENQIFVDLIKDEVWINRQLSKSTKSISWLKTYCYDGISSKRTDIDFPPEPIGVRQISIELVFLDGRNQAIKLEGMLTAPLEVQALVLFLVSFLAS